MKNSKLSCSGIVQGAFYKKNVCGDTKALLWGRSQGKDVFKYGNDGNGNGKISIAKRT